MLKTILQASKDTGIKRPTIYNYWKVGKIKGKLKVTEKKVLYVEINDLIKLIK